MVSNSPFTYIFNGQNSQESVKNDPWTAQRYYAEADKQEELQVSAAPSLHRSRGN